MMRGIRSMFTLISVAILLLRISSNFVDGLPVFPTKNPTTTSESEIRYISVSDITDEKDAREFSDEDVNGEVAGEDYSHVGNIEEDVGDEDEYSGDLDEPTYDIPYRLRQKRKRFRNNEWKINLNRTKVSKNFFQSDIHLDLIQNLKLKVKENFGDEEMRVPHSRARRAARVKRPGAKATDPDYLWKNNTIFYKIDNVFTKDTKREIKLGIRHWRRSVKGCLRFERLRTAEDERRISKEYFKGGPVEHILFTKTESGCWSQVGRTDTRIDKRDYVPGQQLISIGEGCGEKGTVIHEIGHAIGFWHEQSRRDRDEYVKIVKTNIITGQRTQFRRMALEQVNSMGYAYDYWSIMHYGPFFFTKNDRPTIKVKSKYRFLKPMLGQRETLSYLDVAQVRAMYKCNVIPSIESKKVCISRKTKGRGYRGKLDYTQGGIMCQPWKKNYPHTHNYLPRKEQEGLHANFCRNPGGEKERPWCFTTLADKDSNKKWDYCDIKFCDES